MTELETYFKLDKAKAMLEFEKNGYNRPNAIENQLLIIRSLSRELGISENEPPKNHMMIRAYCSDEYLSTKVVFLLRDFIRPISNYNNHLGKIINNSYRDIYNSSFSTIKNRTKEQIDWMKFLEIGRFEKVSEKEYKLKLLNEMGRLAIACEKKAFTLKQKSNAQETLWWIEEQINVISEKKVANEVKFNTQIFTSEKGFILFEALIKELPPMNDNYAFIYRILIEEKYMYQISQRIFKDFVNAEPYRKTLDKIKTLTVLNDKYRFALYKRILGSIK